MKDEPEACFVRYEIGLSIFYGPRNAQGWLVSFGYFVAIMLLAWTGVLMVGALGGSQLWQGLAVGLPLIGGLLLFFRTAHRHSMPERRGAEDGAEP